MSTNNPTLTLKNLQDEVNTWARRNFGPGDGVADNPLFGVVEEVGELAHAHLKQKQGIRNNEDHRANAQDAIGDIVVYLADYCAVRGYDFEACVWNTWMKVKQRDWKKEPNTAHISKSTWPTDPDDCYEP